MTRPLAPLAALLLALSPLQTAHAQSLTEYFYNGVAYEGTERAPTAWDVVAQALHQLPIGPVMHQYTTFGDGNAIRAAELAWMAPLAEDMLMQQNRAQVLCPPALDALGKVDNFDGVSGRAEILHSNAYFAPFKFVPPGGYNLIYCSATGTQASGYTYLIRYHNCPPGFREKDSLGITDPAAPACLRPLPVRTCTPIFGNPITATGEKIQPEQDYQDATDPLLRVTRTYNSARAIPLSTGARSAPQWAFDYQQRLLIGSGTLVALRPDGIRHHYRLEQGAYTSRQPDAAVLTATPTGWRLNLGNTLEHYNAQGQLTALERLDGPRLAFEHDTNGRLTRATARDGRQIQYHYDLPPGTTVPAPASLPIAPYPTDLPRWIELPDNTRLTYDLDPLYGEIDRVTHPDGSTRAYQYQTSAGNSTQRVLTGLIDERGILVGTYGYNFTGAASSTERAGGVDRWYIQDGRNAQGIGSVTISTPLGDYCRYNFQAKNGLVRLVPYGTDQGPLCGFALKALDYAPDGTPSLLTDLAGTRTRLTHEPTRRLPLTRIEAEGTPDARTTATAWHPTWQLPRERSEPGKRTAYRYNGDAGVSCAPAGTTLLDGTAMPLLCQRTENATQDANGTQGLAAILDPAVPARTWRWTYDQRGRILTTTDPLGATTATTWHPDTASTNLRGRLATVTNPLSQTTTLNAYDPAGRLLQSTDPNGLVTTREYDTRGRLTRTQTGAEQTTYTYDIAGRLTRLTRPDGSFLDYTWDDASRLTAIQDAQGNRIAYTLDAAGNRIDEQIFDTAGTLTTRQQRKLNTLGRPTTDTDGEGGATTYQYNSAGQLTTATAPLSRVTRTTYDTFGRVNKETDPANQSTLTTYDAADRVKTVTDPKGLVTTYTYDGLGNLTQLQSPDSGASTYSFDAAGYLAGSTDARNQSQTYTHDALGRMTRIQGSDDTQVYTYDNCPNGKGRLCAMQDGAGTLAWTYDAFGRITQRTTIVGAHTLVTATTYDSAGRLVTLTTPAGHTLAYIWDKDQLTTVKLDGSPLLTDITHAPFGALDAWRWADGTDTVRLYNRNGEPTAQAIQAPGQSPRTTVLTRDAAGRITKIEDTDTTQTYTYDLADRLKQATGNWGTLGYTYDTTGNRLTQTGTTPSTAYTYPATSHRLQTKTGPEPRTYAYDPSGRLTNDGSLTYSYDGAGRLKEVHQGGNTMRYGYSADGRRLYKDNGAEKRLFVHDEQGKLLGEYRATPTTWTPVAEYVWLDELPVATIKPDPANPNQTKVYRIEPDHLGTPRRVTDEHNTTVWRWNSTPFGETTPNEDPDGDGQAFTLNLRFAGQYFDAESKLHYNYNRYFDSQTGRYISSDPIGLEGGINTYGYVENNPLSYTDPTGEAIPFIPVIGLAVGLAIGDWIRNHTPNPNRSKDNGSMEGLFPPGTIPGNTTSKGEPMPTPAPTEMAEQGRNWATEEAKRRAQVNCTEPCDELDMMLEEAKRLRDTKQIREIEKAQKYLHCRNIQKRKSIY